MLAGIKSDIDKNKEKKEVCIYCFNFDLLFDHFTFYFRFALSWWPTCTQNRIDRRHIRRILHQPVHHHRLKLHHPRMLRIQSNRFSIVRITGVPVNALNTIPSMRLNEPHYMNRLLDWPFGYIHHRQRVHFLSYDSSPRKPQRLTTKMYAPSSFLFYYSSINLLGKIFIYPVYTLIVSIFIEAFTAMPQCSILCYICKCT